MNKNFNKYIAIVVGVIICVFILYNTFISGEIKYDYLNPRPLQLEEQEFDTLSQDVKIEIKDINVEVENVDINNFKHNTLPNEYIEYDFLGAIDNSLYGIGRGFSGDGLKEKVIFFEYQDKGGLDAVYYTTGDTLSDDGAIVNMFSVHSIGDNVYSYLDYNGENNSINEIKSFDFNTKEEKLIKSIETNNEFVINDAYVFDDDIYEFTYFKEGSNTISSEKKGVLQSYNGMDYWISMFSDGDKLYYSMSNLDDKNTEVYENDVLICSFNVGERIMKINHYENYFVFESADNMYVYNQLEGSVQEIQNVTSSFIYDNKVYYTSGGNIMFYDFSNDKTENVASLDKEYYKIVGVNGDKVILEYEDENPLVHGLAVYSIDDDKLYKYSELEGNVEIFYNESYIIVVEKDLDNNQLNKFEIKI